MEAQRQGDFEPETLKQYCLWHIMDKRVGKGRDDDSDLVEQKRVWLGINTRDKLNRSKSLKDVLKITVPYTGLGSRHETYQWLSML